MSTIRLLLRWFSPRTPAFLDYLFFAILAIYLALAPYTKVEESFNLQATHDILTHGLQIQNYDHLQFPGVVPRTFTGALVTAVYSLPLGLLTKLLWNPKGTITSESEFDAYPPKYIYQYVVRLTIAWFVMCSVAVLRAQIRRVFSPFVAKCMALVSLSQYHILFWGSRSLPNVFALVLVNFVLALYITELQSPVGPSQSIRKRRKSIPFMTHDMGRPTSSSPLPPIPTTAGAGVDAASSSNHQRQQSLFSISHHFLDSSQETIDPLLPTVAPRSRNSFFVTQMIILLTIATAIFRSELIVLSATICFTLLVAQRLTFWHLIKTAFWTFVIALVVTVPVDSFFWQRWIYPEWSVFWFNTVENKSHLWGTLPFHWYFSSALPKILNITLPIAVVALFTWKPYMPSTLSSWTLWQILLPFIGYILGYSFLPHKEWRFIMYAIPAFNLLGAVGLESLAKSKFRMPRFFFYFLFIVYAFVVLPAGMIMTAFTSFNYPGGTAFKALHDLESVHHNTSLSIHISPSAAMTGITRFGEIYSSSSSWNVSELATIPQGVGAWIAYRNGLPTWAYSKNEKIYERYLESGANDTEGVVARLFDYRVTCDGDSGVEDLNWVLAYRVWGFDGVDYKGFFKTVRKSVLTVTKPSFWKNVTRAVIPPVISCLKQSGKTVDLDAVKSRLFRVGDDVYSVVLSWKELVLKPGFAELVLNELRDLSNWKNGVLSGINWVKRFLNDVVEFFVVFVKEFGGVRDLSIVRWMEVWNEWVQSVSVEYVSGVVDANIGMNTDDHPIKAVLDEWVLQSDLEANLESNVMLLGGMVKLAPKCFVYKSLRQRDLSVLELLKETVKEVEDVIITDSVGVAPDVDAVKLNTTVDNLVLETVEEQRIKGSVEPVENHQTEIVIEQPEPTTLAEMMTSVFEEVVEFVSSVVSLSSTSQVDTVIETVVVESSKSVEYVHVDVDADETMRAVTSLVAQTEAVHDAEPQVVQIVMGSVANTYSSHVEEPAVSSTEQSSGTVQSSESTTVVADEPEAVVDPIPNTITTLPETTLPSSMNESSTVVIDSHDHPISYTSIHVQTVPPHSDTTEVIVEQVIGNEGPDPVSVPTNAVSVDVPGPAVTTESVVEEAKVVEEPKIVEEVKIVSEPVHIVEEVRVVEEKQVVSEPVHIVTSVSEPVQPEVVNVTMASANETAATTTVDVKTATEQDLSMHEQTTFLEAGESNQQPPVPPQATQQQNEVPAVVVEQNGTVGGEMPKQNETVEVQHVQTPEQSTVVVVVKTEEIVATTVSISQTPVPVETQQVEQPKQSVEQPTPVATPSPTPVPQEQPQQVPPQQAQQPQQPQVPPKQQQPHIAGARSQFFRKVVRPVEQQQPPPPPPQQQQQQPTQEQNRHVEL